MKITEAGPDYPALINRIRLISGLTLFSYVLTHLLNHAAGVLSLDAMEYLEDKFFEPFWQSPLVSWSLAAAATAHLLLAMWSIYRRRRFQGIPAWEAAQLGLGLLIPVLLIDHVVSTRIAAEVHGVNSGYVYVLFLLFGDPVRGWLQAALLLIAWIHGSIGLHFSMRFKSWYPTIRPVFHALLVLTPAMALAGYWTGGGEIQRQLNDPANRAEAIAHMNLPDREAADHLIVLRNGSLLTFGGILALTLLLRGLRNLSDRRHQRIRLSYPEGRDLRVIPGATILEISRANGIPHASVCGGRGRCSTCRVKLGRGYELLPSPAAEEARVLERVGATQNLRIRLACQVRPTHDLEVTPLLPPSIAPTQSSKFEGYHHGRDMTVVVMFADLRGFTSFSENKLPYDVVFLLNRYFRAMGEVIEASGGHLDKFIGDGIMALFGLDDGPNAGAINSLRAARAMIEQLRILNADLAVDLGEPLRIGIGLHAGVAIVGDLGYGSATTLTAIGDVVNTASRLEGMTKEYGASIIVSEAVTTLAGIALDSFENETITPRGRLEALRIAIVRDEQQLPA